YVMISVAILILFIACINFMNLATARSAERAREVGVRKTMGSFKRQLVFQFLTESFVLSLIGVVLAVVILQFSLPFFNNLTGKSLAFQFDAISVLVLLGISVVVGFLAGVYPSFVLSSFNPVVVMKGNFTGRGEGKWIRSGLVVFQFWISIVLMIGTMVIQQQMKFMRDKSLGFDKDQVLVVERLFNIGPQTAKTYVDELKRGEPFLDAAGSFAVPGREIDFFGIQFQPEGSSEILTTKSMVVDDEATALLGLELIEGRWFSEETNDSTSLILNEAAVKVMGLDNPIGRKLNNLQQTPQGNISITFTITGIVRDFNFQSLRDQITPLVIQSNEAYGRNMAYALAKVKGGQMQQAIESARSTWQKLAPEQPFKFTFLDEDINAKYAEEQRTGQLFAVFSGLAIFVACIGLFALSAYTASLRTKEIGIRKVLGASVTKILFLLSQDFSKMVLISFALAIPVAWYVMESWWLQSFAYRIQIGIGTFAIAGLAAFVIAWLTVSFQSIKAAVK
ncbi:MAG TPA: FtsX-like permease family protein, partial [Cyclobacteriaceae bacterium]|nr:FtsX-like permease family protein [Cyclobacteriaceae bacterium]